MSKETNDVFTEAYNLIDKELPFSKDWSNGHGLFDFAVYGEHAPVIPNGKAVKSVTPGGRRLIVIGTRLGNFAVYDRFVNQRPKEKNYNKGVFVFNCCSALSIGGWFSHKYLDWYDMEIAVGSLETNEGNIGWRIEQLFSAMESK